MRIAALALGSDAIELALVVSDGRGEVRTLDRDRIAVPLGKGLASTGRIHPEAFQAGLEALALQAERIRSFRCDTVEVCTTAVFREAANAARFIAEAAALGIRIQVLSAEEEARLVHLAARHAAPCPEGTAVLVDIQGGNTSLTWLREAKALACLSLPWGPQRLVDALAIADPPVPEDARRLGKCIRRVLKRAGRSLPERLPRPEEIIGTSDTLFELAGPDGATRDQLLQVKRRLWRVPVQARITQLGVEPSRAGTFHAAASWLLGIMDWLELGQVRGLPVGLREGLVWDALQGGGTRTLPGSGRRAASVERLAARLDPDPAHSRQVARLADQLFLDLQPVFGLGDRERELLGYAARLHDIGLSASEEGHHRLGASLVQQAELAGFHPSETELLAQAVRFHRGKAPGAERHEGFARLAPWHRATVEKLSAILRAADALDRSRRQSVESVRLSREGEAFLLRIQGSGDLRPELERLQEKGLLLFRLLDLPVRTIVAARNGREGV